MVGTAETVKYRTAESAFTSRPMIEDGVAVAVPAKSGSHACGLVAGGKLMLG